MRTERILRWTAIAIAILAFIDPSIRLQGRVRHRLGVVVQDGSSMALTAANGSTRRAAAAQALAALKRDLGDEFDLSTGRPGDVTIVVGDRFPEETFSEDARISTVTVSDRRGPNVRIAGIDAPRRVPPGTTVRLAIAVEGVQVTGSRSTVVVRAGDAEVGRAFHDWTADHESWVADIAALPVGEPPFRFDVRVLPGSGERTDADNHAEITIGQAARHRVFVLEARPSWAGAFVRRALERDPRFDVAGRSRVSPSASVLSGGAPQPPGGVGRFDDYEVVVVGGLDAITPDEQKALEHFADTRGGAIALLPDTLPAAATINRFVPGVTVAERLLEHPSKLVSKPGVRSLESSELLESDSLPRDAIVLATNPGSGHPIVWTTALGEGRLLFSGALDAWRFRGTADEAFERFWRSTIAAVALEARPPVEIQLTPGRAAPGERVWVSARVRKLERDQPGRELAISARAGDEPIRLWPDARRGVFRGSFVVPAEPAGPSVLVTASAGEGIRGQARLSIDGNAREAGGAPLALLAATHGGIDVALEQLGELERSIRSALSPVQEPRRYNPARSPWWFVPFAACLSTEWWLRRRAGRR
jgi:hypothetical protein